MRHAACNGRWDRESVQKEMNKKASDDHVSSLPATVSSSPAPTATPVLSPVAAKSPAARIPRIASVPSRVTKKRRQSILKTSVQGAAQDVEHEDTIAEDVENEGESAPTQPPVATPQPNSIFDQNDSVESLIDVWYERFVSQHHRSIFCLSSSL
jgi:hypothetical protein